MNPRRNPEDIDQDKEPEAWELAMEQTGADWVLQNKDRAALYEFLDGNPCPVRDYAEHCSDENLPRLFESVIAGILSEPVHYDLAEEFQLEMIRALLGGLTSRLHNADQSIPADLPEALTKPLVKALHDGLIAVAASLQAKQH